jgi:hypothetical protein
MKGSFRLFQKKKKKKHVISPLPNIECVHMWVNLSASSDASFTESRPVSFLLLECQTLFSDRPRINCALCALSSKQAPLKNWIEHWNRQRMRRQSWIGATHPSDVSFPTYTRLATLWRISVLATISDSRIAGAKDRRMAWWINLVNPTQVEKRL